MEVTTRAVWARTMLAELNRVLNHLMFLGSYPLEVGAITPISMPFASARPCRPSWRRSPVAACTTCSTGRRPQGGPAGRLAGPGAGRGGGGPSTAAGDRGFGARLEIFQARTRDVGVLTEEQILQYGVSGPIARACGVDFDLRRDEPYLAYAGWAARCTS